MLRQSKWIRWNPSEPASLSLLNSTLPILSTCPSFAGNSQTADLSIALWVSPYKYVALIFSLRPLSFLLLPFNQRKKSQYNSNKETNKAKGSKRQPLRPLLLKWGLAYLFLCIPLLAYQERKKERSEGGRKKGRKERKRERKKRRKEEREKGRKKERKEERKEGRKKERKKESEIAQSCPTLCDPVDCSPPGSSVHGILQARRLEWVAISFSRGSSQPRDQTCPCCRQTLYPLSHQGLLQIFTSILFFASHSKQTKNILL